MGAPSSLNHHFIVLFDGVCNLCTASVQFIINRDPTAKFKFASLQSPYARALIGQYGVDDSNSVLSTIILFADGKVLSRSDAALEIARHLTGPWKALWILKIVPRFIRDAVYNWVARHRYNIFGKKNECMIPTPEIKTRFLE